MSEYGLLGVGQGVNPVPWAAESRIVKDPEAEKTDVDVLKEQAQARDQGIVQTMVARFETQIVQHEQSIDLPSVAANTATTHDVTCDVTERVFSDDWIVVVGYPTATLPLMVMGGPAPSDDTIRLHLINASSSARDLGSTLFYLEIHRRVAS